jgi:uncharacterized protein YjbI with pentapeptide repeats
MRKWLDKLTKLQYIMLAISLFFIWFCICYCVNWAVGDDTKSPSPNDIITFVTLPLTVVAIIYAKNAFNAQKEALELQKKDSDEQKILGAWSLLAQKGTGDLGRKDALEFLHSRGKSLAGLDLSNAHLVGLKLEKANLSGCNFTGAVLLKARFDGASLVGTHFEGANLRHAHFDGATLWCTHFKGADLIDAHFEEATFIDQHFEEVYLWGTHFEGAKNINPANFKNCYTSGGNNLSTAPEGYEFVFEANEDGTQKTEVVDGLKRCYIKLIKTETKNP